MTTSADTSRDMALESISGDALFGSAFEAAYGAAAALETGKSRQSTEPATEREMALDEAQCAVHACAHTALVAAIDTFVAKQVADALLAHTQRA